MPEDRETVALARRPSISDVALRAGVSRAAVSKVIRNAYGVSPDMRTRVEQAIAQLGYRPRVAARAMRGASFTIGLQLPYLDNDFFRQLVEGAAAELAATGYQLVIAPGLGYLDEDAVLDGLVDRQVDGIITIPNEVTAAQLETLGTGVPLVVVGRHDRSRSYDTVTGDDTGGAHLVMDHLLGLGHRRIAHLTMRPPTEEAPHAVRAGVYRDRVRQAGQDPEVVLLDTSQDDTYAAARTLLAAGQPPSAVFAGHDALAVEVLRALADLGRGAEQVSVVGYDNIALAQHPLISLTTVDQFGRRMGRAAIELLMERIRDGRTEPRHHIVDPELRVRRSTVSHTAG